MFFRSSTVETKSADEAVVVEAKSAPEPKPEEKSVPAPEAKAAPTPEANAGPAAAVVAPTVAVKSFASPAFAVAPAQLVAPAIGYPYGINSVFGYSTVLAEPVLAAYAPPLEARFLAAPLHSTVLQKAAEEKEKKQ